MSPAVARVLEALRACACDPKEDGKGWTFRCPAHHDHRPSAHLGEGRDGKALLYCFGGCTYKAIADEIGIAESDLFDKEPGPRTGATKRKTAPQRKHVDTIPSKYNGAPEVARYSYTLDDGTGDAVKIRYQSASAEEKEFLVYEVDPTGGFWCGLGGRKLDLYAPGSAPTIDQRALYTAILSEGEKAADACAKYISGLGDSAEFYVAFGTHGSGSFHGDDGDRLVRGLEGFAAVAGVVDRDDDGDRWAEEFRRHAEARLPKIRFVQSAVTTAKADLADHLAAGYSLEQLVPLGKAAEGAVGAFEWHRLDVRDAIGATPKPIPWRIGGICAKGEEVVLTASGGLGKTYFLMQIAIDAALGRPALGVYPIAAAMRVLWIDEEMGEAMLSDRLTRMALGGGLDDTEIATLAQNLDIRPQQGLSLGDPETFAVYDRTLREGNYGLVVIDSLVALSTGEENKGKDARGFYQQCIAPYKGALGTTFLTAAHPAKPSKDSAPGAQRVPRGSGDWFNQADRTFWLEKQSEEIGEGVHLLKVILHRDKQRTAGSIDGHLIVIDGPAEKPVSVRSMGETGSPAAVDAIGKVNACQHEILSRLRAAPDLRIYQPDLIRDLEALGYDKKNHYYPAVNSLESQRFVKINTIAGTGKTGKWVELMDSDDAN